MNATLLKYISAATKNEDGATAIEYSMIAAFVSVIIVGAVNSIGESVNTLFFDQLIGLW